MDILDGTSPSGLSYRDEILKDIKSRDSPRDPPAPSTTSPTKTPPSLSSTEIINLYREKRVELAAFMKTEGNIFTRGGKDSPLGDYVGLANQGATCYLNSLVQALFMLPSFRSRIFKFRHNPELHGKVEHCIPAQLQILFARLSMSTRPYVSTKALTRSFGWGSAEGFQQHDVQELLVTLMDALERATPQGDFVKDLFQGTTSDYLKGKGFCRRKEPVTFNNLMVPIQGHETLESAIRAYFKPDVLDGNNQYELEKGTKVDALKGVEVNELPKVFIINLGRFIFDYQTMRRVKINDACSLPESINMDDLLKGYVSKPENKENGNPIESIKLTTKEEQVQVQVQVQEQEQEQETNIDIPTLGTYELMATMVHSGTAQGGHYRAFIRDQKNKTVTPGTASTSMSSSSSSWYNFNDSFVSKLTANEVVTMFGRDPTAANDIEDDETEPKDENEQFSESTAVKTNYSNDNESVAPVKEEKKKERAKHVARSATTSYMLIYKKKEDTKHIIPEAKENDLIQLLPNELKTSILLDNEIVNAMAKVYFAKSKVARLTVCIGTGSNFNSIEMLKTATLQDTVVEAVRVLLPDLHDQHHHATMEYRLRVHEPRAGRPGRTFGGREQETLIQLGLSNGTVTLLLESRNKTNDPSFQEYDPNDFYIQLDQWRIQTLDTIPYPNMPPICVEGKKQATVGQLLTAVKKAIEKYNTANKDQNKDQNKEQQSIDVNQMSLIYLDRRDGIAIRLDGNDDAALTKELRLEHNISSGSSIVVERKEIDPDIVKEYERAQNIIVLRYNMPKPAKMSKSERSAWKPNYELQLQCDKRDTLQMIKERIFPTIDGCDSMERFRLKCNVRSKCKKVEFSVFFSDTLLLVAIIIVVLCFDFSFNFFYETFQTDLRMRLTCFISLFYFLLPPALFFNFVKRLMHQS